MKAVGGRYGMTVRMFLARQRRRQEMDPKPPTVEIGPLPEKVQRPASSPPQAVPDVVSMMARSMRRRGT